jgi:hypothetical protein
MINAIEKVEEYFLCRCDEIISLTERGDVWPFLCNAEMIDYLTNMTTGGEYNRLAYINFIDSYFDDRYKNFEYQNGEKDLPAQMYLILRCGLVHRFSLVPMQRERNNGGRKRSIVLAHEKNGYSHLTRTRYTEEENDSVIFTAEQFSKDVKNVVIDVFTKAKTDSELNESIMEYIHAYPPIASGF